MAKKMFDSNVLEVEFGRVSDRLGEEEQARAATQLRKFRHRGGVSEASADRFCIGVLGKHPFEVFGREWYAEPEAVAA